MLTFISVCQEGSVASLKYVIALSPCTARSPLLWQWPAFQYCIMWNFQRYNINIFIEKLGLARDCTCTCTHWLSLHCQPHPLSS